MGRRLPLPRPPLPRFALSWFPAFEGMDRVEALRKRYDSTSHLVDAHLTLVFPFPAALTALQIGTHVRRVAARWPAIPVTFRGPRMHANEFVFLMASRGAASIKALHDALYTRSLQPHLRRDIPYEPHITVARDSDLAIVERALEETRDALPGEYEDVMRELTLLEVAADGKITSLETIPLGTA
ncbi:MAG TPA: 2'-5' RNA ligase family protein [Usitatibacter sp.]|nr:2'-5' RNA ligase family protein [Usitatibacter sp.]